VPAPASLIPEIFGAGYRQHVGKSYAPELTRVSTLGTAIEKARMSAICAIDRQRQPTY
jgi:hypothetical protein